MNIVILGGGYGGYETISRLLKKEIPKSFSITLLDRAAYHSIKTEFHSVAAGSLCEENAILPFPKNKHLTILTTEIVRIDIEEKQVHISDGNIVEFDLLVIALGSEDQFWETPGASEYAYSIQSLSKAKETRQAIQLAKANSIITIVGAGLTGVELASELAETRKDLTIRLLDKGESVLPSLPKKLQTYVQNWLTTHGVEVIHGVSIDYIEHKTVCNQGHCLKSDVTIWAGGTQPCEVVRKLNRKKDRYGRLLIDDFYRLMGDDNVFVIGDCSSVPYPPSAQVAKIQGVQTAGMIKRILEGKQIIKPTPIKTKGTLGSLGKKEGFGFSYTIPITGKIPRFMKSGVLWLHKFNR